MDEKLLDKFYAVLNDIMKAPGSFKEKAEAIKAADTEYGGGLEEFLSWFDGE